MRPRSTITTHVSVPDVDAHLGSTHAMRLRQTFSIKYNTSSGRKAAGLPQGGGLSTRASTHPLEGLFHARVCRGDSQLRCLGKTLRSLNP